MVSTSNTAPAKWHLAGVSFPPEDRAALRGLAISAAWANGLLEHPPTPAPVSAKERRCPLLPPCFPLALPEGLVVATDEGSFHGRQILLKGEEGEAPPSPGVKQRCPFQREDGRY